MNAGDIFNVSYIAENRMLAKGMGHFFETNGNESIIKINDKIYIIWGNPLDEYNIARPVPKSIYPVEE